jgi:lipopolysaccharide/colanic/teichoic acid biosynthesis glycosyltransferase
MNIVGPRPHPVSNSQLFLERIPYYALRGAVRPGITGWAQIQYGYANGLEEETEKMRYDLFYIKHRSLSLDLRILLQTIRMVIVDRHCHESVRKTPAPAPWSESWGGTAAGMGSR